MIRKMESKKFRNKNEWNKVTIIKPVEWIINVHSENMKSWKWNKIKIG